MPKLEESFFLEMWVWLGLTGAGGMLLTLIWLMRPATYQRLLPPQRHRAVSWFGAQIIAAYLLAFLLIPIVVHQSLVGSHLFQSLYGPDFRIEEKSEDEARKLDAARANLWTMVVAFPLQVGLALALFGGLTQLGRFQLGLSGRRASANAILGFLTWALVTPSVLGLNLLVVMIYDYWLTGPPDMHPLTELVKGYSSDRVLLFVLAVFAAPVVEELYFRGILQPWAANEPGSFANIMAAAVVVAIVHRLDKMVDADVTAVLGPALFILLMVPGELVFRRLLRDYVAEADAQAIYATSLLFASLHSSIWPSPIPLFFLSLALGWLAYRTQSVVGAIVFHGLFNLIAAVTVVLGPVP